MNPAADADATARRNVFILAACLALSMTGVTLIMNISALAGKMLADDESWATFPLSLQFVGVMVATIPAFLLMGRIRRRVGFTLGQIIGVLGAILAAFAIYLGSFELFAAAHLIIGFHNAFWQYYRFAAADTASESYRTRAISYVMAGGVVAAIAGSQLASWTSDLLSPYLFAGGYVCIACLNILTIFLLQGIRIPNPISVGISVAGRPLIRILRQPTAIVAIVSAMLGYASMSLVMTATPLAMQFCGFVLDDSKTVIQWHALAMFAPSFFTGRLIKRFGVLHIIIIGALLNIGCMAINLMGIDFNNFLIGLVLLGLGWNFMFVGGTTLLTETYRPEEQPKVQAANDFLIFTRRSGQPVIRRPSGHRRLGRRQRSHRAADDDRVYADGMVQGRPRRSGGGQMKPTCVPFSNGLIELCAAAKSARFSAEKRDRITAKNEKPTI